MLTRLLILWLLSERPLHGYKIKRALDEPGLRFWFPIEYASIYSLLRTLVREELVVVAGNEQDAGRPPRTLYRITRAGRKAYAELLRDAWRRLPAAGDPFQLALAAQPDLPAEELIPLREERIALLEERLRTCDRLARAAPDRSMVERTRATTEAELQWLRGWSPTHEQ